jgi:hypothetical protein
MSEQYGLSRELAEEELSDDSDEGLEEARPTHRKPVASGQRRGGSEEKAGTVEEAGEMTAPEARPAIEPPPLKPDEN